MGKIDFDIIVVGGGLVGSGFALDLALQNHHLHIAILEHKPYTTPDLSHLDNRIYAISPKNIDYLQKLGVLNDDSRIGTIKTMDVSGDTNGNIILDHKSGGQRQLYLAKTIENNNLQYQLYSKLNTLSNITFIYDELKEINYLDNQVQLSGQNKHYTASLVVGADGANSFVRQQACLELNAVNYPHYGVVANFKCEYPHNNVAYQWFDKDEILAYLPLQGNQISIVWSTTDHKRLLALDNDEFADLVRIAGKNKLGKLEVITKAAAFPLRLYMLEQTWTLRTVLIGDAAHTIHPLAGQGVNLGFGDARLLAHQLASCRNYQVGDSAVLAKFNALRMPEIRQMQLSCHFLYKLFGLPNPILKQLRNYGLNLVDSLPMVKKYLIKKAISF